MEKRKRGRPRLDNARRHELSVRISDYERDSIEKICVKTGKSKTDLVRELLSREIKKHEFLEEMHEKSTFIAGR